MTATGEAPAAPRPLARVPLLALGMLLALEAALVALAVHSVRFAPHAPHPVGTGIAWFGAATSGFAALLLLPPIGTALRTLVERVRGGGAPQKP